MNNNEQRKQFIELVSLYRSIFSAIDVLRIDINEDDPTEQAEQRHYLKLLAIAAALEGLPRTPREQASLETLRLMVEAREWNREQKQAERGGPTPEHTYHPIIRDLVCEHLATLGLSPRILIAGVPENQWLRLLKLTFPVIECIKSTPLAMQDESLLIDKMPCLPNAGGYVTTSTPVNPPYWIAKVDIPKLWALESALDGLALNTRH